MFICPKCGKEYPNDFEGAFCPLDGSKLSKQTASQPEDESPHLVCPKCGREFPDGSYCRADGTRLIETSGSPNAVSDVEQPDKKEFAGNPPALNGNPEQKSTEKPKGKKKGKKTLASRIAKVIGILFLSLIALFLLFACIGSSSSKKWPKEIHTPSIEEIEDKANSLKGPKATFSENPSYKDSYHVLLDNKEVGTIYLNAYDSEDVGLYVERSADDPESAFSQLAVAAIMSCDPSNKLEDAKELLKKVVDTKEEEKNGVKYTTTLTADRLILRIDVPENVKGASATASDSSESEHTHKWVDATCTEPKTCSECGATEGDPLGHDWKDATATEPKTCSRCGATEGYSTEEAYNKGKEYFANGDLKEAQLYFASAEDYRDSSDYISLIDRVLQFNGVYVDKQREQEYIVLNDGRITSYSHYHSAGYDSGVTLDHVPQEEDGRLVLIDKYEYQGTSSFINTKYYLKEEDGNKSIETELGLEGGRDYVPSDKTLEEFEKNPNKTPQKVAPSIGMTADEVRNSTWGSPSKINATTTAKGTHEQWVYSTSRYIYLDNGIVTSIQD